VTLLYFASGQPGRLSKTGSAGYYVGDEWDLIVNFHLGPRTDVLTGYCTLNWRRLPAEHGESFGQQHGVRADIVQVLSIANSQKPQDGEQETRK